METINIREIVESQQAFLDRLYFVLVSTGYRRDRGDIAYVPINDTLEVQFKLNICDLMEGACVCVFNSLIERVGLSIKEVLEAAYKNSETMFPQMLFKLSDILPIPIEDEIPIYVLTNARKTFGAGTILYSGIKEKVESMIGDFIVIPSSVHETLLVPEILAGDEITEMIREVNRTVVDELEVLSDRPYKLIGDRELIEV